MPRPKVSSEGKSPLASQDESGATTADPMSEFLTVLLEKFDEVNMQFEKLDKLLVGTGNKLDDMVKETRNVNQRRAGLQHQAQQPRLAMKADALEDKKTRESTEDFAQDGRLGDITSDRVHDPMRLTSFGDQGYTEPPALPCKNDALVKPCLPFVEMRKSTPSGSLLHAGAASSNKAQGTNFPPQLLPWSFRETSEEKNICSRETFAKYIRSWHPKGDRNEIKVNKIWFLTQADCQVVCVVAQSGRATHVVEWGGRFGKGLLPVQSSVFFFSRFHDFSIFLQTAGTSRPLL